MNIYYTILRTPDIRPCKYYKLISLSFFRRVIIQDYSWSSRIFFHLLMLELNIIGTFHSCYFCALDAWVKFKHAVSKEATDEEYAVWIQRIIVCEDRFRWEELLAFSLFKAICHVLCHIRGVNGYRFFKRQCEEWCRQQSSKLRST